MNYEANTIGTGIASKLGLGAFAKAGNTSGIHGTGASGFKPAGGGFKATGAQRYIGDGSQYKGDPNESFQSVGSNILNSSLMQDKAFTTPASARQEEEDKSDSH